MFFDAMLEFFIPLPKTNTAGEFQLDKCAKILDCGKYLDSMISVISRNWENPMFYPPIDQLRTFREKIEKKVAG